VRGERHLRVHPADPERLPDRGIGVTERIRRGRPEVVEGAGEQGDRAGAVQHHRVVVLHVEPAPAEVGRAAQNPLAGRPVDHDDLVVLEVQHVLANPRRTGPRRPATT
jgi:hypothetical protein